jgi:hypothetical protein
VNSEIVGGDTHDSPEATSSDDEERQSEHTDSRTAKSVDPKGVRQTSNLPSVRNNVDATIRGGEDRSSDRLAHVPLNNDTEHLVLDGYKAGWICATSIELAMATEMLDEVYDLPSQSTRDDNLYILGRIGLHNVAIASLPAGRRGAGAAAAVASRMRSSFKSLRLGLLVGIGGGVPLTERDIRLGDVVVSQPDEQLGGVVQYDLGKREADGGFRFCSLLFRKSKRITIGGSTSLQNTLTHSSQRTI